MANDRSDRSARIQQLIRLSNELKELNHSVQHAVNDGSYVPDDLLVRNRDLVRRCDEVTKESSSR